MSVMMKKAICVILIIVLCFFLCGCGIEAGKYLTQSQRFLIVSGSNSYAPYNETIIVDEETGVMYLVVYLHNQFGITPLLNADGTPMLAEEDENEHFD